MLPTREIYWNIVGEGGIYALALVAAGVMAYGFWRRVRLWRLGRPEQRLDRIPERLRGLLVEVFGQRRLLRDTYSGVAHLLVFYGFLAQLLATSLIAIQEWTGTHFLKGSFYLGYSLVSDVFGILGIVGLGMLLWRRAVQRPARLHSALDDWVALVLLLLVFIQGFVIEGLRIAATELQQQPELARWSPGGYALALVFQGLEPQQLLAEHRLLWWVHALTAFVFLGYLAWGKLNHVFYALLSIFLRDLDSTGRLRHADIEAALDEDPDSLASLGVGRIEAYTWKDLLDLDACMSCGRCEAVCPAHLSGVPLSPRKLIRDLKDQLTRAGGSPGADSPDLIGGSGDGPPASAVLQAEVWGCRTCGACQRECPVYVEHVPKIVGMRRHLVMTESRMSDAARLFLKNLDDRMHPWTGAAHDREEWFADLDVKVLGRGETADLLFWVGCTGAMVERNIRVSRAMVKLLDAAGVDFAILGAEEACTGDPARRAGGELTFQSCAKTNIETLERYGVRRILTTCPHCFNTFRNEYPDFGGRYEVIPHAQLIADLLRSGRLKVGARDGSFSYHDACYLGRHNGVFDAPREILGRLAASGEIVELPRSRSRSLCCGAGGGYAWMDDEPQTRINQMRLDEVKACGAGTLAVACPFCMQMFEDALGARGAHGGPRAADIAELVAEALEEQA